MISKNVRRATADDVPVLTQIRNDAHARKVAHGDYVWGREGDGFSERWVRNHVAEKAVYVVEQDGALVGTFSLDFDEDRHWGRKRRSPVTCMGFACGEVSTGSDSAASCSTGALMR
ncbi:hypothetical protein SY91_05722 [Burkholderia cenocepacia]|uniref:hypothetical protein n=1 Tax=Burkholderia cenocepacia TaxID=95486 RepID=UPI0018603A60|nr:hypothetical protein [Burkholderia cenocepacia]QND98265.1 hypothetical protein SY91_05722 [Burkholderia cenocepacia]